MYPILVTIIVSYYVYLVSRHVHTANLISVRENDVNSTISSP